MEPPVKIEDSICDAYISDCRFQPHMAKGGEDDVNTLIDLTVGSELERKL